MKISKKWENLGWKENDGFHSPNTFTRIYEGKTQVVTQSPNRIVWAAIQYNELDVNVETTMHRTVVQALSRLNN
jgi:hypothetical protein